MTSETRTRHKFQNTTGVIVTPGVTPNALGVIRSFGRRGIPVMYIDSVPSSIVRYSRYINKRLTLKKTNDPERDFINLLKDFGMQNQGMLIIPVGDEDALALAKHREELERFYHIPVTDYETMQNLVDKKRFYRMLGEMQVPHPKTYFPESPDELVSIGKQVPFPYIIKPSHSALFQAEFGKKNSLVRSAKDLEQAAESLRGKNLEVVIQEIIPGRGNYAFYAYFNRQSELLAICGYDRIREYPPDFGSASLCGSRWRPAAADPVIRLLQTLRYHGFAEPELKMDPRDGQYKLIEINARTTLQNRLPAACGIDIEYIAFLDANGSVTKASPSFRQDVLWADDFLDLVSLLRYLVRRNIGWGELLQSFNPRKVRSTAAWDDPVPLFARAAFMSYRALYSLFRLGKH